MKQNSFHEQTKGKLIISCQALADEPLYSPFIMGRLALAAAQTGASGIRANSIVDIQEIKKQVNLPIIGIIKADYEGSDVFITPTKEEIDALASEGVDVIAMDATNRKRPDGTTISELFPITREKHPDQLFMADCSTLDDAIQAEKLGFDYIGSTLHGYTAETKGATLPNVDLIKQMIAQCKTPIIAEGGIWTPEQLKEIMALGIHTAVVGSAITRPQEIAKKFIAAIE